MTETLVLFHFEVPKKKGNVLVCLIEALAVLILNTKIVNV